jgi:hypothetical protein
MMLARTLCVLRAAGICGIPASPSPRARLPPSRWPRSRVSTAVEAAGCSSIPERRAARADILYVIFPAASVSRTGLQNNYFIVQNLCVSSSVPLARATWLPRIPIPAWSDHHLRRGSGWIHGDDVGPRHLRASAAGQRHAAHANRHHLVPLAQAVSRDALLPFTSWFAKGTAIGATDVIKHPCAAG